MKTVVGLFDDLATAHRAVETLQTQAGVRKEDVNLVAAVSNEEYGRYFDHSGRPIDLGKGPDGGPDPHEHDVSPGAQTGADHSGVGLAAGMGAVLGGLGGLLIGLSLLPIPGVGPIVAAGPIAATLVGAARGALAGGLMGALTGLGVPETHAQLYVEGVHRGGTLVIVKSDEAREHELAGVLNQCGAIDVEERAAKWREGGWVPLTAEQIAEERRRWSNREGSGMALSAGAAAGAAGGAVAGAALGSALLPGPGIAVGAMLGAIAGALGGHEVTQSVEEQRGRQSGYSDGLRPGLA